jgi:hypothetical protein
MASFEKSKTIFAALSETGENAGVALFIALLRASPLLLKWLRVVSLRPAIFEHLAAVVEYQVEPPEPFRAGRRLLAWLARTGCAECTEHAGEFQKAEIEAEMKREPTRKIEQTIAQTFESKCEQPFAQIFVPKFAQISERNFAQNFEQETTFLRQKTAPVTLPTYGGLTAREVLALVRYYQSGHLHPSAFLLAHAWREARCAPALRGSHTDTITATPTTRKACDEAVSGASSNSSPASDVISNFELTLPRLPLLHATLLYVQAALQQDRPWLLHHLSLAAHFFHTHAPGTVGQKHFGHSSWWKLHLLHYMIAHPKPAYRLGEFAALLHAQRLEINPRMLRRFCSEHGIARDSSPGRPRKKRAAISPQSP